ncbi:MAG: YraN family protein [Candidatus Peregrinibacteria bacterium]
MNKKELGNLGETYAQKFLVSRNYKIIKTNYYCRHGEIDIIALDMEAKNELVFFEIKSRTSTDFGTPAEAVTFSKRRKIITSALHFLSSLPKKTSFSWRIDLIALILKRNGGIIHLSHLKHIFDG